MPGSPIQDINTTVLSSPNEHNDSDVTTENVLENVIDKAKEDTNPVLQKKLNSDLDEQSRANESDISTSNVKHTNEEERVDNPGANKPMPFLENSDLDEQSRVNVSDISPSYGKQTNKEERVVDNPGANKSMPFSGGRNFLTTIHFARTRTWASVSSVSAYTYANFAAPKVWQKRSDIFHIFVTGLLSMRKGTAFSLLSIFLCMVTQMYPSCPRFGVILAPMCLLVYTSEKQRDRPPVFFALLCSLGLASIFMDIDWLSSCYDIAPIDSSADYDNYDYAASMGCIGLPSIGRISWWALLINIPVKIVMILITVLKAKSGQGLMWAIWKRLNFFCPPCTTRTPKDLYGTIQTRVIAIEWIELVCATTMLLLTFYVYVQLDLSIQFNFPAPFISLKVLMLIKGFFGFLVFGSSIKNTDILAFLSEFGCRPSCKSVRDRKPNGEKNPKVNVNGDFICFNSFTKLLDLIIGAAVWYEVIWLIVKLENWKAEPKPIRVVLGAVIVLQILTDVLVVVLATTVIRLIKVMKEQNQMTFRRNGFGARETQMNAVESTLPTRLSVYIGSDIETKKGNGGN